MVQNEKGFDRFGTQQVVGCSSAGDKVFSFLDLNEFGGNTSIHAGVHLVTSVGDRLKINELVEALRKYIG